MYSTVQVQGYAVLMLQDSFSKPGMTCFYRFFVERCSDEGED